MKKLNRLLLGIVLLLTIAWLSPRLATADPMQEADSLFAAGQYQQAVKAYQGILNDLPDYARAWMQLGLSYHSLKEFDRAIDAYRHSEAAGYLPAIARYNIACALSLTGHIDEAFAALDTALAADFAGVELLNNDTDLNAIRNDKRFAVVKQRAQRNATPCDFDERFRQLDFWIGNWNVYTAAGQLAGTNKIEQVLGGCALQENWQSRLGQSGKSTNYFDPGDGQWHQDWVDVTGTVIHYIGTFHDGAMHFDGRNVSRDGSRQLSRMTLTPMSDGTVHQIIEQSTDGGENWYLWFEGIYRRD